MGGELRGERGGLSKIEEVEGRKEAERGVESIVAVSGHCNAPRSSAKRSRTSKKKSDLTSI